MPDLQKKIGDLLLERRLIQEPDLRKALALQKNSGGRVGAILIRSGAISEDALLPVLAVEPGGRPGGLSVRRPAGQFHP